MSSCLARTAPALRKARTLAAILKTQTVLDFYGLLWVNGIFCQVLCNICYTSYIPLNYHVLYKRERCVFSIYVYPFALKFGGYVL